MRLSSLSRVTDVIKSIAEVGLHSCQAHPYIVEGASLFRSQWRTQSNSVRSPIWGRGLVPRAMSCPWLVISQEAQNRDTSFLLVRQKCLPGGCRYLEKLSQDICKLSEDFYHRLSQDSPSNLKDRRTRNKWSHGVGRGDTQGTLRGKQAPSMVGEGFMRSESSLHSTVIGLVRLGCSTWQV